MSTSYFEKEKIVTEDYYPYIKGFFKKFAGIYNIAALPLVTVRKKVIKMAAAGEGAEVLDIATGTGKQAFAFARNGYKVTGIDLSEDMLKIARRNNKYANLDLKEVDAACLPFEDSKFDVSCVSFALHDMPSAIRERVVGEMARVTKQGGVIVAADYALPKNGLVRYCAYRFIRWFESKYYPEFIDNNLHGLLKKAGIRIEAERKILFGAGVIIRGAKG
ncbi:MAG: methyltransferase domain-containing protein [Dehalococcoidales bacterium]|nr:methyltransferase domain-containing protein [Dehalococcoidales bacterium]